MISIMPATPFAYSPAAQQLVGPVERPALPNMNWDLMLRAIEELPGESRFPNPAFPTAQQTSAKGFRY
jgi:hypothetical protein